LFLYLFQRAKGSTSEVAPVQTFSKVKNITPLFRWFELITRFYSDLGCLVARWKLPSQ
jgi:hypothetical protein